MKATVVGHYRSRNSGLPMLVCTISGSNKELEAYKEVQGDNYRENEKQVPLFYLPVRNSDGKKNFNLIITGGDNPRVVVDKLDVVLANEQKIAEAQVLQQGRIRAEIAEGITFRGNSFSAPVSTAPANTNVKANTEGGTVAELEEVAQGTDGLGD